MKGENRLKILEFIEDAARAIDDVFFIFSLPYGTSYGRMQYFLRKKHQRDEKERINREERRRFNDLIYRLRKDGLVAQIKKDKKSFLRLTPRGEGVLEKLRLKKKESLPVNEYEHDSDALLKIVIFDIPETEKRKRSWLRSVLKNLDFTMLQKSVWIGKTKLPPRFLFDLNRLNLLPCVEIFEISKAGSLKQLKP